MSTTDLYQLGVYELMKLLHELHKLGYQKLRWMSYLAPTGFNLRCHITTPDRQIICGDMNIVASELDCWDGKYKRNQANFYDWERNNFRKLMERGHLIDTFRTMNPFTKEFSYFFRNNQEVRACNQGHRIDYFLASRSFLPQIVKAEIIKDCTVSTNNPILLEIKY